MSETNMQAKYTMNKIGLTLGKFASFHKGHQWVIETALAETDTVFVIIYDTALTSLPLSARAGWIKIRYPQVNIIEAWDGPEGYGDSPEIKKEQEAYIIKKLDGQRITHFFSSEFYGEHVSQALGAIDRRVDEVRVKVPDTGTLLRENTFAKRHYWDESVYSDLIVKVCFMGASFSGKSTLTKTMAARFGTKFMPEYGGEFWLQHQIDRRITVEQFEQIAPEHIKRENALVLNSNQYLFCDTCPITTYVFAKDYHQKAGPILTEYAQKAEKAYDLFFSAVLIFLTMILGTVAVLKSVSGFKSRLPMISGNAEFPIFQFPEHGKKGWEKRKGYLLITKSSTIRFY